MARLPAFQPISRSAAREIYADHVGYVARLAHGYGLRDAELEDAVQDVFITFFQKFNTGIATATPRTWLYTTTHNVCRNRRRSLWRSLRRWASDALATKLESKEPSAERLTDAQQTLHRLLDKLDDDKRQVFELAEIEQFTLAEIGALLGVSSNTVGSRLSAARKQFDDALQREQARHDGGKRCTN